MKVAGYIDPLLTPTFLQHPRVPNLLLERVDPGIPSSTAALVAYFAGIQNAHWLEHGICFHLWLHGLVVD